MERICIFTLRISPLSILREKTPFKLLNKNYLVTQSFVIKSLNSNRTGSRSYRINYSLNSSLDQQSHGTSSAKREGGYIGIKSDSDKAKPIEDWSEIAEKWYKQYRDFVGISEILDAQEKVSLLTNQLIEIQSQRRKLQRDVEEVHEQLLATHQRITKSELYSEDHYILFEKARQLSSSLKNLQAQFIQTEEEERNLFTQLSTAIKYCHEKERTQSEQSKYWSILISVISATLAALITSINNWVRIREIKDHASLLHRDAVSKVDEIRTALTEIAGGEHHSLLKEALPDEKSTSQSLTLESIQSVVGVEMDRLTEILKMKVGDGGSTLKVASPESQEVGYFNIACSMLSGAFLGVLITYNFFGTTGGGPG